MSQQNRPKKRKVKQSKATKKASRMERIVQEKKDIENLTKVISAQALPLDAQPDYLERDPKEFYPAAKRCEEFILDRGRCSGRFFVLFVFFSYFSHVDLTSCPSPKSREKA
jgi:hypothetical protein